MAQYYGQDVYMGQYPVNGNLIDHIAKLKSNDNNRDRYLELRSVSDLTDEEAIEVGEIINVSNYKYVDCLGLSETQPRAFCIQFYDRGKDPYGGTVIIYLDGAIIWHYENIGKYDHHCLRLLEAYSYLRQIGILLPFTYISDGSPITLSTEEIIKRGWARVLDKSKDNGK